MKEMAENIPDSREYEILSNADFFEIKKKLSEKVMILLGNCTVNLEQKVQEFESALPAEVLLQTAKISRGENYRNAPWFNLDYPRYFKSKDIFALRTLVWFGNSFSITLHLSGKYAEKYREHLTNNLQRFSDGDFYICINEDEWEHHFDNENYQKIKEFLASETASVSKLTEKKFIKISRKISFANWSELPELCVQTFALYLALISSETTQ